MIKKLIPAGFAAIVLGFGLVGASPADANAGGRVVLHGDNGSLYFSIGQGPRSGVSHRRHHKHARVCRPGKAVHKAERRGIRHARIHRVNGRFVVVKGRKRGHKVKMAFYRDSRRCEVAWVKRKHRGYRY